MQKTQRARKPAARPGKPRPSGKAPSPALKRLRKLAKKHRPPQEWYDDTSACPFKPAKS